MILVAHQIQAQTRNQKIKAPTQKQEKANGSYSPTSTQLDLWFPSRWSRLSALSQKETPHLSLLSLLQASFHLTPEGEKAPYTSVWCSQLAHNRCSIQRIICSQGTSLCSSKITMILSSSSVPSVHTPCRTVIHTQGSNTLQSFLPSIQHNRRESIPNSIFIPVLENSLYWYQQKTFMCVYLAC